MSAYVNCFCVKFPNSFLIYIRVCSSLLPLSQNNLFFPQSNYNNVNTVSFSKFLSIIFHFFPSPPSSFSSSSSFLVRRVFKSMQISLVKGGTIDLSGVHKQKRSALLTNAGGWKTEEVKLGERRQGTRKAREKLA